MTFGHLSALMVLNWTWCLDSQFWRDPAELAAIPPHLRVMTSRARKRSRKQSSSLASKRPCVTSGSRYTEAGANIIPVGSVTIRDLDQNEVWRLEEAVSIAVPYLYRSRSN